jgi:hypothetical protein
MKFLVPRGLAFSPYIYGDMLNLVGVLVYVKTLEKYFVVSILCI